MKRIIHRQLSSKGTVFFWLFFILGFLFQTPSYSAKAGSENSTSFFKAPITITGKVIDAYSNEPLIGATIKIKDSFTGTITDKNGEFELEVPEGATLIVSYIGYIDDEVIVTGISKIQVTLLPDLMDIDELIVIGYGTAKKSDLTGSITSVSASDLKNVAANTIDAAMQGKTAGVTVLNNTGAPGSEVSIYVRGIATPNNTQPLYIVDGVPISSGNNDNSYGINSLNPNDIESIQVLKDAAASAIYGSRASNGVILITTKKGKSGRMSVNLDYYHGSQSLPKKLDVLNRDEFIEYYRMLKAGNGVRPYPELMDTNLQTDTLPNTDWQDLIFRVAPTNSYQFSLSGGSEVSTFLLSVGHINQDGIVKKSGYSRTNFRLNSDHTVKKWLKIGQTLSYGVQSRERIMEGGGYDYSTASPIIASLMADPISKPYNDAGYWNPLNYTSRVYNPVGLRDRSNYQYDNNKFMGSLYGEITFLEGLVFKSIMGIDITSAEVKEFRPSFQISANQTQLLPYLKQYRDENKDWAWENTLTYNKQINNHSFNVMVGATAQEHIWTNLGGQNAEMASNDINMRYLDAGNASDPSRTLNGGMASWTMYSYLGRLSYNYNDKYLLATTLRRDGSSRFGDENRFGVFPSVSAAWRFSNEGFMSNIDFLSIGKLRLGWGQIGNQEIGYYDYTTVIYGNANYPLGVDETTVVGVDAGGIPGNRSLKWETTENSNVGVDLGFLNNRGLITVDYFYKTNHDMLMGSNIPTYIGHNGPIVNAGKITNKGWDGVFTFKKLEGFFNFDLSLNATYVKNEIVDFGEPINGRYAPTRSEMGHSIAEFYGYKTNGLFQSFDDVINSPFQANAQIGDQKFVDINGDNVIDDKDLTFIGSPLPDWTGGFTANFYYKNFDLGIFIQGVYGNEIFNNIRRDLSNRWGTNQSPEILNSWTYNNTNTNIPRFEDFSSNNNLRNSDRWIESGSFTRVKNITLGYSLPSNTLKKLDLSNVRIYASVQNLYTFTKYSGYDPEIGRSVGWGGSTIDMGYDIGNYPQPKTLLLGVNVSF